MYTYKFRFLHIHTNTHTQKEERGNKELGMLHGGIAFTEIITSGNQPCFGPSSVPDLTTWTETPTLEERSRSVPKQGACQLPLRPHFVWASHVREQASFEWSDTLQHRQSCRRMNIRWPSLGSSPLMKEGENRRMNEERDNKESRGRARGLQDVEWRERESIPTA